MENKELDKKLLIIIPSLILAVLLLMVVALWVVKSADEKSQEQETEEIREEEDMDDISEDEVFELRRDDADRLIEEKLTGSGCEYEFSNRIDDAESFYVYDVLKDGELLEDEQLAVNTQSGEVFLYRESTQKTYAYSQFSFYDPAYDDSIDWTGVYGRGEIDLVVEEDEPGGFGYAFYEGYNQLYQGYAQEENHISARSDNQGDKLQFTLSENNILVTADSADFEYAGEYRMK